MLIWQGIVFITLLVSYTSWDATQAAVEAVWAVHDPGRYSWYLSLYPNNRFLALIQYAPAWIVVRIFGDRLSDFAMMNIVTMVMQIVNIAIIDGCILWVRHLLARYSKTAAGIGFLLMSLLLGCSRWIMIPYTDTLGLPFSILLISTAITILEPHHTADHGSSTNAAPATRTMLPRFLLLGCAASLAYVMKPSTVIPAIAFAIIWLILNMGKRLLTVFLPTMLIATLGFTLVLVPVTGAEHAVFNADDSSSVPMTHFIMMGLVGRGAFNGQDVDATISKSTKQAKEQFNLQEIRSRLHDYGPAGYLTFLLKKSWYTTAVGTLGYYRWANIDIRAGDRGSGLFAISHNNPIAKSGIGPLLTFQDFFLDHNPTNILYKLIMQTFYIPLVIGMLLFAVLTYRRRTFTNVSTWLTLSLFGGFLFLMLFESGMSRYLIQFLPLIVMLSGMGWATWKESELIPFLAYTPDTATGGQC
ncbi:hypothetical protein [Bifidobacterium tissieri]|uniref:Glycosyltransferase RgtA/B/C/D-like domain-containing protein n=1 Tax=Bifidobacterium tissieri TaxID=1630162 RepID=A0A5M9ZW79_9BIFI|nr:hypothetical protein [Bifidobacterium tissieri]KAA8829303.1 hypothetical protein EMO89_08405 [Bifidobacterium tissieri]KAA8831907.1 hypothetical protein EM849_06620 [Bifidobacterium tissieri]